MTNEVPRTRSVLLYYFSGTGNSRRLAEVSSERFKESGFKVKVKNIEDNEVAEKHNDYSCHGFIFPSLGFGIAKLMTEFMQALPPATEKEAFIIVSMGNEEYHLPPSEGKCLGQGKKILEKKGYKVVGGDAVAMPNNWITGWSAPPPEKAALIVEDGEKAVREFIEKIINGEFYMKKSHWLSKLLGITVNPFMLFGLNFMYLSFYINDKCNSCEICAKICPVENIAMINGKPKWGKECFWCHRCLNLCPKESAQGIFIGTSAKRRRYKEPHLKVKDLIREKGREPVA
jgi:flavodoxin/NAD-dependent dihydropyrimidine dehydrogenase PreA subunit